jgi:hypothetical protein
MLCVPKLSPEGNAGWEVNHSVSSRFGTSRVWSAVACWLFKPFSPAARWTRLFRGGAGCTRLERTSLRVHIALRAYPSLGPIAVSFPLLDSSAVGNCSRQIVQCVQGSRFRSLPTVPRTLSIRLDIPIELFEQTVHLLQRCSHRPACPNGPDGRPKCTCHAWKRRIPTLRTGTKGTQPLLRGV